MTNGVNIPIAADASGVIREAKKITSSFDDVVDSLDQVSDEAKSAGQVTEKALAGIGDEANKQGDRLEDSFRSAFAKVEKQSKSAGDAVGDNTRKGYADASRAAKSFEDDAEHAGRRASETTDEFKDEARSNFSEVASSFSGDMDSAADLVQGTLGGLAGSLTGPIGLALGGLGAAAGLFYNAWKENSEKTKQTVSDMYDDMLESGADFLSKDYIADQLAKIYQGADDAAVKVKELRDLAEKAQVSEPLLARALVGDKAARDQVSVEIAKKRLEITSAMDEAFGKGLPTTQYADALLKINGVEDALQRTGSAAETARQNADAARAAISGIQAPTQGVAASAEDARAKFDGVGRSIDQLAAKRITIPVDADLTDARRQIKQLTDGSYTVTVNGRAVGMRIV